eukprot:TRINITY_DN74727_c0_g1_i1.p3 TRINITY_DN74727_c0_g1~~TRINITY_DN74727_c0_g1_i1.p3  ORF type:complete len:102 (-),score=23.28 TRINITY_DN74727_c0_g1_i1:364-669(-)
MAAATGSLQWISEDIAIEQTDSDDGADSPLFEGQQAYYEVQVGSSNDEAPDSPAAMYRNAPPAAAPPGADLGAWRSFDGMVASGLHRLALLLAGPKSDSLA